MEVRLAYCGIRDDDVNTVMDVLLRLHGSTCTFIDLSNNEIMDAGVRGGVYYEEVSAK